jgi:hypothetical protein
LPLPPGILTDGPLAPPDVCMLELLQPANAKVTTTLAHSPIMNSVRRMIEIISPGRARNAGTGTRPSWGG